VGLDRALLDEQALRDVAVGLAQGDRLQDVAFPGTDAGQVPGPYNTFLIVVWTRGRLGYPAPAASAGLPPDDRG
jgi:hypothetical protein